MNQKSNTLLHMFVGYELERKQSVLHTICTSLSNKYQQFSTLIEKIQSMNEYMCNKIYSYIVNFCDDIYEDRMYIATKKHSQTQVYISQLHKQEEEQDDDCESILRQL